MALTKLDPSVIGQDSTGASKITSAGGSVSIDSTGSVRIANSTANSVTIAANGNVTFAANVTINSGLNMSNTAVVGGFVGVGGVTPIRHIHIGAAGAAEFIIEQTDSPANHRKWNILADGGNSTTNGILRVRMLNDNGVGEQFTSMIWDGAGRVRKPMQTFFSATAHNTGGTAYIASPATYPFVTWTLRAQNSGGASFFDTSTGIFTAPVDGVYAIETNFAIDTSLGGTSVLGRYIYILSFNGSYEEIIEMHHEYQNDGTISMRYLTAGTQVRVGLNGVANATAHGASIAVWLLG